VPAEQRQQSGTILWGAGDGAILDIAKPGSVEASGFWARLDCQRPGAAEVLNMMRMQLGLVGLGCTIAWWAAFPAGSASAPASAEKTTPYVRWAVVEDPVTNQMHGPLVFKDMVVVGTDDGELRAYRISNGERVWSYRHGKRIFVVPCTDGERIYFTADSELIAVTPDSGTKVWSFDLGPGSAPPVLALPQRGLVFTADCDGNLYAVNAKTGKRQWVSDFIADAPPDPPRFAGARARFTGTKARPTGLASDGETIFLTVFDQCRVVAFGAAAGKRLWSFQTGGWVFGAAVATSTRVLVGSQDTHLYCLDKQSGKQVWKFKTKGRVESCGAVDTRFVYFGSCDGNVYCLNQADGAQQWQFHTDPLPGGGRSAIYSVPILRQGSVYIAAGEGQFYALNAEKGNLRWKLRPSEGSGLYCYPATDGKSFFVVTRPENEHGAVTGVPSLVAISLK
jgi:outer membrane protein assembly factor BamB